MSRRGNRGCLSIAGWIFVASAELFQHARQWFTAGSLCQHQDPIHHFERLGYSSLLVSRQQQEIQLRQRSGVDS